jgi:hypothetical protein
MLYRRNDEGISPCEQNSDAEMMTSAVNMNEMLNSDDGGWEGETSLAHCHPPLPVAVLVKGSRVSS